MCLLGLVQFSSLGSVLELQDWIMTINKLMESVGMRIQCQEALKQYNLVRRLQSSVADSLV